MKFLGVIPARYASTRFPGKPLIDIAGKAMIQRVYEQASKAVSLADVIVATDDNRIREAVLAFGGKVCMTAETHQSGTDRCAEVAQHYPNYDAIINIQGDEPFIDPAQIDALANCLKQNGVAIATLIKAIKETSDLDNPNLPKVVCSQDQRALYFSRSAVPHLRGIPTEKWLEYRSYYKHIGLYGYRRDTLLELAQLQPSALEQSEALEQLRWLDYGYSIHTAITQVETIAIDTPEDLQKAIRSLEA